MGSSQPSPSSASGPQSLQDSFRWTTTPLISSAPMRLISGPSLAVAVSQAGGLGFIGAGSDLRNLGAMLKHTLAKIVPGGELKYPAGGVLPVGVGFLNWGADLKVAVKELSDFPVKPAAVWFFAPRKVEDLVEWTSEIRKATEEKTKIWVQVGTVTGALQVARLCKPDALVVQGSDAGGHGLAHSSSLMTLLPEVRDTLKVAGLGDIPLIAAGGIMDGRGVAAAIMLGASGVCLGTRFLASDEAEITEGYQKAVLDAVDGGVTTVRTKVYDHLRGTRDWPDGYNGRGVINKTFTDWESGMSNEENQKLYEDAMKIGDEGWGKVNGRLTTYAGTGVGLVRKVMPAGEIVEEVTSQAVKLLNKRYIP